jgi:hypothetical protein
VKNKKPRTKAISNAGENDKMKLLNKNKHHSSLKMSSVKTRTAHSRDRYAQAKKVQNEY